MARLVSEPNVLHINREPFDAERYQEEKLGLTRFDTRVALSGLSLCSAMLLLENDTQAVQINGRVGMRREGPGGSYIIAFMPTDRDLLDSPPLKVISHEGVWQPYNQTIVVNGRVRVQEGFFADKVHDTPEPSNADAILLRAA